MTTAVKRGTFNLYKTTVAHNTCFKIVDIYCFSFFLLFFRYTLYKLCRAQNQPSPVYRVAHSGVRVVHGMHTECRLRLSSRANVQAGTEVRRGLGMRMSHTVFGLKI